MLLVVLFLFSLALLYINSQETDFEDENDTGPFIPIATEEFTVFMGRAQAECEEYKFRCQEFVKCFGNCNEQLIYASELNGAGEGLTEEQKDEAEYEQNLFWKLFLATIFQTNPCVGMFAYCMSVDFFTLRRVLRLKSPDAF